MIILAKLSDLFGRKPLIVLTVLLFTIFSAGCGAAQSFTGLYVAFSWLPGFTSDTQNRAILRAFQGIGGGGIYTLVFVISLQMVPKEGIGSLSAILSSAYAFSAILGPVLGGLISDHTTWRWVFFMKYGFYHLVLQLFPKCSPTDDALAYLLVS